MLSIAWLCNHVWGQSHWFQFYEVKMLRCTNTLRLLTVSSSAVGSQQLAFPLHFFCYLHTRAHQMDLLWSPVQKATEMMRSRAWIWDFQFEYMQSSLSYACFHQNGSRSSSSNQELWCYSDHQHHNVIINKLSELMTYKPGTLSVCFVIMHRSTENNCSMDSALFDVVVMTQWAQHNSHHLIVTPCSSYLVTLGYIEPRHIHISDQSVDWICQMAFGTSIAAKYSHALCHF